MGRDVGRLHHVGSASAVSRWFGPRLFAAKTFAPASGGGPSFGPAANASRSRRPSAHAPATRYAPPAGVSPTHPCAWSPPPSVCAGEPAEPGVPRHRHNAESGRDRSRTTTPEQEPEHPHRGAATPPPTSKPPTAGAVGGLTGRWPWPLRPTVGAQGPRARPHRGSGGTPGLRGPRCTRGCPRRPRREEREPRRGWRRRTRGAG